MSKDTEQILNHLLFHKAIVREGDRQLDIDTYVNVLHKVDEGMHVVIDDPIEKAVAIAFQLVMENKYDPWQLDLMEFTKVYMNKVKKETEINFIVAGRLVMWAWSVLRMQSDRVLLDADKQPEIEEFYFDGWDISDLYQNEADVDYSQIVLESEAPIINEAVRSNDVRPVSLYSLLEAFDEAREEIELKKHIQSLLDVMPDPEPFVPGEKLHQEDLEENISITWQRICQFNGGRAADGNDTAGSQIPITKIWNGDPEDKVRTFISTLFLAKMHKIQLSQRRFPYGEIMVKNIESQAQPKPKATTEFIVEPQPEAAQTDIGDVIPIEHLAVV